ncbi:MAG: Calx-beta domain-containing protein, partial [Verrucomicrobiota bacterium]|nr:Calx-beta domain-containing protein [Verrucomicrobiota bacterium]
GTAVAGQDYTARLFTLTFDIGEVSKTFSINITNDVLVEGTETVNLSIFNPTNAVITLGNAMLTIVDDDFAAGELSFSADSFAVSERATNGVVTVRRTSGTTGVISVSYATSGISANSPSDYQDVSGVLTFGDGETVKSFLVPIKDDFEIEGNESINVTISNPVGGTQIIGSTTVILTIVDDDLGPGSVDATFDPGAGANAPVRALLIQPDHQIVIGGEFTTFDNTNRSRIARLNLDGSLDISLTTTNGGPSAAVMDVALESDGQFLIAGLFSSVDGINISRAARLNSNGSVDSGFNLPLGLNGQVSVIVPQPDGKALIGGMFDEASAALRNRIARLKSDGTVDIDFDPGSGADNTVHAIALLDTGKVLIGGAFNSVNGITRRGIARLNANGSVDTDFNTGSGANGPVHEILLLADGDILVAGDFTSFNNQPRVRVARLNSNGSLDTEFNPGTGPNGVVYAMAYQMATNEVPAGIFIAGDFSSVNGVSRPRIARLNLNGSLDTRFNPGAGANAAVYDVAVHPRDGRVIIVGAFTSVDHQPRAGIARFNNERAFLPPSAPIEFVSFELLSADARVQFRFQSELGITYALQASEDLESWTTVQTVVGTGIETEVSEPTSGTARFFRILRITP